MHGFIAYVLLTHKLGKPPAEWAIAAFVEEHGKRFESGQDWELNEYEVGHFAVAE